VHPSIKQAESSDHSLEAAKWFQLPMLISSEELEELFEKLGEIYIVKTLSKLPRGTGLMPVKEFIALYRTYIEELKNGTLPDPKLYRSAFSSVITSDLRALYALPMENFEVIKVKKPIIQMQYHTMTWSQEEDKFRSQLFGKDSIPWGLMFSYPQIILDPETKEILKPEDNSSLFRTIQLWQREKTTPTPFLVHGKKINAPQRIGRSCLSWINNHPSLRELSISVAN